MNKPKAILFAITILVLSSCANRNDTSFDASGSFEADEVIISAEASGLIKRLNIEEGQKLKAGQVIGYIDSVALDLKKKQLEAQLNAILSRKPDISVQLSALQEQLRTTERERERIENLVKGDAATPKQLDDIEAEITVLEKQIEGQSSALNISSDGLSKDAKTLMVQIEQLEDQLKKCKIINPQNGTVLSQYAETNEMTVIGKPLYKIADLSTIFLRAYISGNQLPQLKLNQNVTVLTDDGDGGFKDTEGSVVWINDEAEFTPKTIQTKEERANLVYAIKVKVKNDGSYKVGMYGEVKF